MKHLSALLIGFLAILGVVPSARAQTAWAQQYELPLEQRLSSLLPLRDGGFLLVGRSSAQVGEPSQPRPYLSLVRTNAVGDTAWTKQHLLRQYSNQQIVAQAEDNANHVLLAGNMPFETTTTFLVLIDKASGDTLWVKPTPSTDSHVGVTLAPNQIFVLAANAEGHPRVLEVTPAGQVATLATVDYSPTEPGTCTAFVPVAGGYWLLLQTNAAVGKFVFVSTTGVIGPAYAMPMPLATVRSFRQAENGNFLLVLDDQVIKLSSTFNLLWTKPSEGLQTPSGFAPSLSDGMLDLNGNYAVLGLESSSHYLNYNIYQLASASGELMGRKSAFGLPNYGDAMSSCKLTLDPATGNYIVAANDYSTSTPQTWDFFLRSISSSIVTATSSARNRTATYRVYPNPLTTADILTIECAAGQPAAISLLDAQGRTVRSWHAQPVVGGRCSLSLQGLAAGLYQLRLTDSQGQFTTLKVMRN